jgi:hypothetical protein
MDQEKPFGRSEESKTIVFAGVRPRSQQNSSFIGMGVIMSISHFNQKR